MGMEDVEHPQWRLRRAIISSLDRISKSASGSGTSGNATASAAESFIVDLWSRALCDDVLEVRNAAATVVGDLVSSSSGFGKERVAKLLVPVMNDMYTKAKPGGGTCVCVCMCVPSSLGCVCLFMCPTPSCSWSGLRVSWGVWRVTFVVLSLFD
jgi:hypothetical protein